MIKVGIFWALPDGEGGQTVIYLSRQCELSEANSLGFIDYPISHFEAWDTVKKSLTDDCYYYPRGRVIYDANRGGHRIYADKCVLQTTIEKILNKFGIKNYILRGDEHYVCPKCQKKKGDKK